ncbi:response regulator [Paraburkholderia bonniea]|uniref:PIG-L family deacetylase n=1 Tax=Paraburkholderia bonniea TaxID=2152891 RepID=UPI001290E2DF|nr:PIG-L family deacetylase [Paraburkholderia bonniea]WJF91708.1 response regulator [Paraburkholderia bonniea]WJF95028.1 response regulator [Paraburkholderia bonniea]
MPTTVPAAPFEVLLIEDSAEFAVIIRHWLEQHGFANVTHAADGKRGMALVHEARWDLVIADIELPDINGLELVQLAKQVDRWLSVLIITGVQSMDYAQRAVQSHADGLLFKPFPKEDFLTQVRELATQTRVNHRRERRSVLAIGAHPDDVEIGCGGALARHLANGDDVAIVTLSHGASGGDAAVRAREAAAAAQLLGARLNLGNLTDTRIPEGGESITAILEVIARVRPTHVYTHSQFDTHQDHRNTHHASMVAVRTIPNVYCYQAPSATVDFRPNLFIDISAHLDTKLAAIAAYESQTSVRAYLAPDLIQATARYWGRFAGFVLAEPMEIVRQRND